MELIEQLDGIVMRDQRAPPQEFASAEDQRRTVYTAAKAVKEQAATTLAHFRALRRSLARFDASLGEEMWSAVMLEEVFDIEYIPTTAVDAPEIFDELRGIFRLRPREWRDAEHELEALAALPVRKSLRRNAVRNHALEQALIACRRFWNALPNRRWSRSSLTLPGVRAGDRRDQLQGACERFVVDMLTAAGVELTLKQLNSAWSALDKRLAKGPGTAADAI